MNDYIPYTVPSNDPGYGYTPKKKKNTFLRVMAMVLVVAMFSVGSVGGYIIYRDLNGPQSGEEVEKTSQSPYLYQVQGNYSELLSSLINSGDDQQKALSVAEVVEIGMPSTVGIEATLSDGISYGSGVVTSENGYIVTNAHVVEDASSVKVYLSDESTYNAKIVGSDAVSDIAVLKINASGLTPAVFADSDSVTVGEICVAIGNPLGLEFANTVTGGYVSAVDREVEVDYNVRSYIQHDAAINNGNSGGALFNTFGQVIGINSAKVSTSYAVGLGFAIPSNDAVAIMSEIIEKGYVAGRPSIGISGRAVTDSIAWFYGYPYGVCVLGVNGKPAIDAGLQINDIITAINGTGVLSVQELNREKNKFISGDTVALTVFRNGNYIEVELVLGENIPDSE